MSDKKILKWLIKRKKIKKMNFWKNLHFLLFSLEFLHFLIFQTQYTQQHPTPNNTTIWNQIPIPSVKPKKIPIPTSALNKHSRMNLDIYTTDWFFFTDFTSIDKIPGKEQITLVLMLHETMQFSSIYKKTILPSLGWKATNFTGHGSSAPFILKIGYSGSMSLK